MHIEARVRSVEEAAPGCQLAACHSRKMIGTALFALVVSRDSDRFEIILVHGCFAIRWLRRVIDQFEFWSFLIPRVPGRRRAAWWLVVVRRWPTDTGLRARRYAVRESRRHPSNAHSRIQQPSLYTLAHWGKLRESPCIHIGALGKAEGKPLYQPPSSPRAAYVPSTLFTTSCLGLSAF